MNSADGDVNGPKAWRQTGALWYSVMGEGQFSPVKKQKKTGGEKNTSRKHLFLNPLLESSAKLHERLQLHLGHPSAMSLCHAIRNAYTSAQYQH